MVIGVAVVAQLVVNIGQPQIFSAVTSLAVILIYLSYLLVTVPMLSAAPGPRRASGEGAAQVRGLRLMSCG